MCKNDTAPIRTKSSTTVKTIPPELLLSKDKKEFSLAEVKRHNRSDDAWVAVHDKVLDITKFSNTHPGGKDLILLASGRDATILFETYHPRPVSSSIINKLQIGILTKEDNSSNSFYSWKSDFYPVLRSRVVERLEELKIPRRGGYSIQVKALMLLTAFWFSLIQMYLSSFKIACVWSLCMGCVASFVGTCIQHDGNHGAFSTNSLLNKMAGWTLDMIGASAFTWEFQHMLGHHPYTNLIDTKEELSKENGITSPFEEMNAESDPDVFSSFPFVRMHPYHKAEWYHKYQHLYTPILFSMMTLLKVFQQDIETIWYNRLYHIDATPRYSNPWNVFRFWGMKILSFVYMVLLPCYFHGIKRGMMLFLLGHFACGELLATMFIVNHVIEGVAFAENQTDEELKKPHDIHGSTPMQQLTSNSTKQINPIPLNDWAAVQCQTSVNWSSGSWFWNHFSGGLSHQIEHHLFPSICHTNYVYIHDVVQKTCQEYGVPYRNEPSLAVAYKKMMRHLFTLGQGEGGVKKVD